MEDREQKAGASPSNRLWLIISAIMAVTLIAVFMVPDGREQAEDIPLPAAPTTPVSSLNEAEPDAPRQAEMPAAEEALAEGEAARRFLAESPDLDAGTIFRRAEVFRRDGRVADAWLLYFKAARDGHAQAAMVLAEQADPAFFDAASSMLDTPDLVQAHKWYELARRNGSREAGERLDKLMKRLEQAAADGDRQAQVLLAKWK